MEEIFISKIHINKVRHLENVDILLSEKERKHLILTGKNGSGKTSLHNCIADKLYLIYLSDVEYVRNNSGNKEETIEEIIQFTQGTDKTANIRLSFNLPELLPFHVTNASFIFLSLSAKRRVEFSKPDFLRKIDINHYFHNHEKANRNFIDYLVNLRAERSFATEEKDNTKVSKIDNWFLKFENALRHIFDEPNLVLEFVRDNFQYNFYINLPNREPFDFLNLSDGYSSILDIVSEIMIRMESKASQVYDLQGIVLIDEIETHLHIDLQKKILPFLTSFFPKIQFIVTTHSPFVLSSVNNAVIFDLETKQRVEDLSGYSVEGIVESYFDVDQYSDEIKAKLDEYETLLNKSDLTSEEKERKLDLKIYFKDNIAKTLSPELSLRIKELETQKLVIQ
ncbi:AAA family ATPase [Emticicia sp. W12TSBA100-4]|uniref:AAA family ATPase n=1 Tax=Emticicia sp. W12TSBA100-4 TaxID=3160965 RepID=UPI00330562B5